MSRHRKGPVMGDELVRERPKLTIVFTNTGRPSEWGDADHYGELFDEHDVLLWGHYSSSRDFLEADLLRNFHRAHQLSEMYPAGYHVVWKERSGAQG